MGHGPVAALCTCPVGCAELSLAAQHWRLAFALHCAFPLPLFKPCTRMTHLLCAFVAAAPTFPTHPRHQP